MDERKLRNAGAYAMAAQGGRELAKLWKHSDPEAAAKMLHQAEEDQRIADQLTNEAWGDTLTRPIKQNNS